MIVCQMILSRIYFFVYLINVVIVVPVLSEVLALAWNKAVVSGEIVEEAVVVGALPILEALELNLPWLLFFGVADLFANVG